MKLQKAVFDKINFILYKESANSRKGQNDKITLPRNKIKFNYFTPKFPRRGIF
jgi:hypothetical protein